MKRGFSRGVPGRALLTVAVLCLAIGAGAADAPQMATHVQPSVLANGYWSEDAITNTTDEPIEVKRACPDGQSQCPAITDRYAARDTVKRKREMFGTDIQTLTLDARLNVETKVWSPFGQFCFVPGLTLSTSTAWFYDLPSDTEFETYLWFAVPPGQEERFVTIDDPAVPADNDSQRRPVQLFEMERGARIERLWSPTVRIYLGSKPGWGHAPAPSGVYAFAYSVHKATKAITPHLPK